MAQKTKAQVKSKAGKSAAAGTKKSLRGAEAKAVRPAGSAKSAAKAPAHAQVRAHAKKPAPAVKAPAKAPEAKKAPAPAAVAKVAVAKKAPVAAAPKAAPAPVKAPAPGAPITVRPQAARPLPVMKPGFGGHQPAMRAVPAVLGKSAAGQKITAPVAPTTPKAIAEKAAAARNLMSAQKKPVSQRHGFKTNEFIVYPAHGVGRIIGIEEQEIAGMSLELFVINFDKEKLTLRVPTGKLQSVGMRKLADEGIVKKAIETLKGRARIKRTMWSRRAQEYVAKINSGDLISIAEVVRDLYRSEAQPEQSYSERQLYEDALDRMAREIAAVEKLDERGAVQRITEVLSKSARGRRLAETGEADVKAA